MTLNVKPRLDKQEQNLSEDKSTRDLEPFIRPDVTSGLGLTPSNPPSGKKFNCTPSNNIFTPRTYENLGSRQLKWPDMYRVTCPSTVASGNARIITHATENSSRVEVGGKVFINAKVKVNKPAITTSQASLAHRNNDCMKFSWDPIQVVNLSRQQKVLCTRELTRLSHLQRHFTRQSHIENYQQNNQIDKYRQRLVRLNRLRMLEGEQYNSHSSDSPTHNSHSTVGYRDIGNSPRATTYVRRHQSSKKPSDLSDPAQKTLSDKKQSGSDKGLNKPCVKYTNSGGNYLTPSYEVNNFPRVYVVRDIINNSGQATTTEIKSRKRPAFIPNPCYQKLDKQLNNEVATERKSRGLSDHTYSAELESKGKEIVTSNTRDSLEGHLPKLSESVVKKKSVKFRDNLDTIFEVNEACETPRTKRPGIKSFVRMASLARNFESGK